ncbi:sensor histidine kinase [Geotalea uraniireducens]|uniref:histidine kinase n=1 Tax=Geotalea uraniireducens (strain Rf4) TaxID=351605 RepID=A5GD55_GEOUR|nr:sensor histidine kinase [Geotalea uraniireducens]ABQ24494.1 histidine kinase [Geotalea uraniireducens Rf4]
MNVTASNTRFASPHRSPASELNRQRALLTEDDSLPTVLNAMPQVVMILNLNRQILFGNRALEEFAEAQGWKSFVGLRPGELLSCQHAIAAEAGCGTGESCCTCGAVEGILAALAGAGGARECRVLRKTRTGIEALDLKLWGTPFIWKGGSFALVAVVDISDKKRRQLLEKIFFHDILNIAGALGNLLELLAKGVVTIDKAQDDLIEMTQDLISEIRSQRELLAAESNELKVNLTTLHSRLFLEWVIRTYRNASAAVEKEIVIAEGCCGTFFTSDEILLGRVLGNLVKNALEASAPGQRVTLGCSTNGAEVSFSCHNEGVIPRKVQLQIFLRSFTTKDPGRGVGTYSVKLLTERYLQGTVSFVSTPAEGTTFTATLPIVPVRREEERWAGACGEEGVGGGAPLGCNR